MPSLGFFDAAPAGGLSDSESEEEEQQEVQAPPSAPAVEQPTAAAPPPPLPVVEPAPESEVEGDAAARKRKRGGLLSPEEAAALVSGATASYVFVSEKEDRDQESGFYSKAAEAPSTAAHIRTGTARTIDVADSVVAFLLAGGGKQIKALEDASGCRVLVDRNGGKDKARRADDTTARKVTLVGNDAALREGERRLHEVVLASGSLIQRVLKCNAAQAGAIIGRGGATVKRLQAATGTHISVSGRDGGGGGDDAPRTITIKGAPWHVDQAARLVFAFMRDPEALEALLTEASAAQAPAGGGAHQAVAGGAYGDAASYDAALYGAHAAM